MKHVATFIGVRNGMNRTKWAAMLLALEHAATLGYSAGNSEPELAGVQIAWTHQHTCATNDGDQRPNHIVKCDCDHVQLNLIELTQRESDQLERAMKLGEAQRN